VTNRRRAAGIEDTGREVDEAQLLVAHSAGMGI